MLALRKYIMGPWEKVRGDLYLDLCDLQEFINANIGSLVFNGVLLPSAIEGDNKPATRYVANTGTITPNGPKWDQVELSNGVKGRLPFSNLVQATIPSVLVGRESIGTSGDFEQITLGPGLSMLGTVLSAFSDRLRNPTLTTPPSVQNGDAWVEASGVSPNRTITFNVHDAGVTQTILTFTY